MRDATPIDVENSSRIYRAVEDAGLGDGHSAAAATP